MYNPVDYWSYLAILLKRLISGGGHLVALFCAVVDFRKAFAPLWQQLLICHQPRKPSLGLQVLLCLPA